MLASAPRRHLITAVVGLVVFVSACKKAENSQPPDDKTVAAAGDAGPDMDVPPPPEDAAKKDEGGTIKITIGEPEKKGNALAKRCTLDGDPLVGECVGGGTGLAFDAKGTLYLVDGKQVRRYTRIDGDAGCHYAEAGEAIELPPDNPRPQSLNGPVYMRSGGAAWHLVATEKRDAVYAHDFLGGLFRIDRGKPEAACVDVFGYDSVAARGKDLLIARKGIEKLALGKKCKASSAKIDDKARGKLVIAGGLLHVAHYDKLTRYDGKKPTELGEGTRICSITGLAPCGDGGVCAIDNNCMQVIHFGSDGKVARVLDDDILFDTRPWSLADAATRADGSVFVYARHRDKTNGKEICEGAIYELPQALFAL